MDKHEFESRLKATPVKSLEELNLLAMVHCESVRPQSEISGTPHICRADRQSGARFVRYQHNHKQKGDNNYV